MTQKRLLVIIAGLVLLNITTIMVYVIQPEKAITRKAEQESAATVGKTEISAEKWQKELKDRYGKSVLEDLIDSEVIKQQAKKHDIQVTAQEVEREYLIRQISYSGAQPPGPTDKKEQLKQIKEELLLEELLTKDAVISEQELSDYYENNRVQYTLPDAYHLAHIITETEEEAKKVITELENGSEFTVLAMEKSRDEYTAQYGGDLGFLSEGSGQAPDVYFQKAKTLKPGEWSDPAETEDGFAVLFLKEKVQGKEYTFGESKRQIHRDLALEQMQQAVTAEVLWKEEDVDWLYEGQTADE